MNIIDELKWRGALNQATDEEGLRELTEEKKIALYCGTDPSGDSLHIGHLIPFMMLKRFQLAGHKPVILIGGGTGAIGDPSGRKKERDLETISKLEQNVQSLTKQMIRLFGTENFTIVNNYDWLSKFTMIDFLHLYRHNDVQLQIGGSDQWGNITSGIDLIHKVEGSDTKVFGVTIPLMLKADGTKFGKTAGGAVWLDPEKTSPYEFYQFWLNQDDRDVVKYLKYFTFLSQEEIAGLEEKVQTEPWKREAQRRLAQEVTTFVHGQAATDQAEKISAILFSGNIQDLTTAEVEQAFAGTPSVEVSAEPANIVDWLVDTKIEPSKRQAREDVKNGAIRVNGEKVTDLEATLDPTAKFDGKYVVIRRGKKNYTLAKVHA